MDDEDDDFLTTGPISDQVRTPEERYDEAVVEALADNVITPEEKQHLAALRRELGLAREVAKDIFQRRLEARATEARAAPDPAPESGPGPDQEDTHPAAASHGLLDRLVEAVQTGTGSLSDLHLAPEIPAGKLRNARRACEVPEDEQIALLIDATVFGSAKCALLVGLRGVYFRNDWSATESGAFFVTWSVLAESTFTVVDKYEVQVGPTQLFNTAGSTANPEDVQRVLSIVQRVAAAFG